jgi:hypothetical protein
MDFVAYTMNAKTFKVIAQRNSMPASSSIDWGRIRERLMCTAPGILEATGLDLKLWEPFLPNRSAIYRHFASICVNDT